MPDRAIGGTACERAACGCVVGVAVSVEKCRECSDGSCLPACSSTVDEASLARGCITEVQAVKRDEPLHNVVDRVGRHIFGGDVGCVLEDVHRVVEGVRELAGASVGVKLGIADDVVVGDDCRCCSAAIVAGEDAVERRVFVVRVDAEAFTTSVQVPGLIVDTIGEDDA